MKLLDLEKCESLEADSMKICKMLKKLYGQDNIVILTQEGDTLGTFSDSPDGVTLAMIKVANDFHNKGIKKF